MSIPSSIAMTFRVLLGHLFKHVCSPNCAFPGKLWCGLQLWTPNIKTIFLMCKAFSHRGPSSRVCGSLVKYVRSNGFRRRNAIKCPIWTESFWAHAYVNVFVYMFVCDLLQSLGKSQSQFSDEILDLFFSCHSSPLVSTSYLYVDL